MRRDLSVASVTGPLVRYVHGFVAVLQSDGYRPASVQGHVELLAHVSRWLETNDLDAVNLTSTRVDEFLLARQAEGHVRLVTSAGIAPLLNYLRELGVIPEPFATNQSTNDELLAHFSEYLVAVRGLAQSTARDYVYPARSLLDDYPSARLGALTVEQVLRFVTDECRCHVPNPVVTGLRAFLRYCYVRGLTPNNLASAIPAVANVARSSLAKSVAPSDVRRLLESCDRTTVAGSRNLAILSLLSRLGLRSREVAAMELSDIDWRRGEITVRGKGPRLDALPLPVDVGEALAEWLATSRPPCAHPRVFCRLVAPLDPLTSVAVTEVVAATCRRARVPVTRAHALRHGAARDLLRSGSNLREIAQVLRHEDVATTSVYAKADHVTLVRSAQPWPEAPLLSNSSSTS